MPPVSEAQRRAMHAANAGKSTLGIPKKVAKEFVKADPGGKLPEIKKDRRDYAKGGTVKDSELGVQHESQDVGVQRGGSETGVQRESRKVGIQRGGAETGVQRDVSEVGALKLKI